MIKRNPEPPMMHQIYSDYIIQILTRCGFFENHVIVNACKIVLSIYARSVYAFSYSAWITLFTARNKPLKICIEILMTYLWESPRIIRISNYSYYNLVGGRRLGSAKMNINY